MGDCASAKWFFGRAQDTKKAAYTFVNEGVGPSYTPTLVGEDGSLSYTSPQGLPANTQGCYNTCSVAAYGYAALPNRFVSINHRAAFWVGGASTRIDQWRPSGEVLGSPAITADASIDGGLFGWDGDALVAFYNPDGAAIRSRRFDINSGATLLDQVVAPGSARPMSLALGGGGALPQIAVVGVPQPDRSSVSILVRNQDGSESLPVGSLAKGTDITDARVVWDGALFRSFFTSKVNGGVHQIHTAALSCD